MNRFRCNNMPFRRCLRQSPVGVAGIAHNSQRSRRVAAGAASLRSLAHWASASLHPALLSLGFVPKRLLFERSCCRRRLRIVLAPVNTLWGLSLLHERSLIRRRRLKGAFQRTAPAERFCLSTSQRRRHVCSFLTRKRNSRFCSRPWPA